jgi:hypothetical protein
MRAVLRARCPSAPIGEAICQKSAGLRELSKLHPKPPLNAGSGGAFLLRAQSNTGENDLAACRRRPQARAEAARRLRA